jgi:hypothetical protein
VIRLRVMHDGPFGILVQESPHGWQQPRPTVFATFAKDLSIMQHDPATNLLGMPLEFVRQLVRGMSCVDEQQIARINVHGQRIALDKREVGNSTFDAARISRFEVTRVAVPKALA